MKTRCWKLALLTNRFYDKRVSSWYVLWPGQLANVKPVKTYEWTSVPHWRNVLVVVFSIPFVLFSTFTYFTYFNKSLAGFGKDLRLAPPIDLHTVVCFIFFVHLFWNAKVWNIFANSWIGYYGYQLFLNHHCYFRVAKVNICLVFFETWSPKRKEGFFTTTKSSIYSPLFFYWVGLSRLLLSSYLCKATS